MLRKEQWHLFSNCFKLLFSVDLEEEKGGAFPLGLSVRNCKSRRKRTIYLAHQPKFEMSLWLGSLLQLACVFSFHLALSGCSFMLGVLYAETRIGLFECRRAQEHFLSEEKR